MINAALFSRHERLALLSIFLVSPSENRYYADKVIQPDDVFLSTDTGEAVVPTIPTVPAVLDESVRAVITGKGYRTVVTYQVIDLDWMQLVSVKKTMNGANRQVSILYKPVIQQQIESPDPGIWFRLVEIKNIFMESDLQIAERIEYGIAGHRVYLRGINLYYPTNETAYETNYSISGTLQYARWVEQNYPCVNSITVGSKGLYTIRFGRSSSLSRHLLVLRGVELRILNPNESRIDYADIEFTNETVVEFIDCEFAKCLFSEYIITDAEVKMAAYQFLHDYTLTHYEKWGSGEPDLKYLLDLYRPLLGRDRKELPLGVSALQIIRAK